MDYECLACGHKWIGNYDYRVYDRAIKVPVIACPQCHQEYYKWAGKIDSITVTYCTVDNRSLDRHVIQETFTPGELEAMRILGMGGMLTANGTSPHEDGNTIIALAEQIKAERAVCGMEKT